jgi:hypothetical protein
MWLDCCWAKHFFLLCTEMPRGILMVISYVIFSKIYIKKDLLRIVLASGKNVVWKKAILLLDCCWAKNVQVDIICRRFSNAKKGVMRSNRRPTKNQIIEFVQKSRMMYWRRNHLTPRWTNRQSGITRLLVLQFFFKMRVRNLGKKL